MEVKVSETSFQVISDNKMIIDLNNENPIFYIGKGRETVDMYRGNYKIEDYVVERVPLMLSGCIRKNENEYLLNLEDKIECKVLLDSELLILEFAAKEKDCNRFWIRIPAEKEEKCYGCGEQMSYFNLRGRNFPIWTSEPGVGRDKTTYVTWRSDVENKAGGDYYNTNYPQPTYISTKHYFLHVDTTAYCDFNFKNEEFHELQIWEVPSQIRIEAAPTYIELLEKITAYFGRQPKLPEWVYHGLIMGVQGGNERAFGLLDKTLEKGIKVAGIWCQDWCGKRMTSFGKRLQWDWKFHKEMYPQLPEKIKEMKKKNIRFLGYVNPYLVNDGILYQEGKEKGYFATKQDGSEYLVDFGEFNCGVVDLTNPEAFEWFKSIIKTYTLGIGIDGWMADFGEYLPTDDIALYSGISAMKEHNHWPLLWAKCNYEAVKESGKLGEVVYFMRAGAAGIQKYCTLLWAGDQSVDFSVHDGLASVICGALSAGIMGCGLTHSDIGGYTSLFDNIRSKELFLRWAEMAMFTPVMRTHEGNRPDTNFQYYEDEDAMEQLARLVDIYTRLAPYTKSLVTENAEKGIPVQRPLFIHYEEDAYTYDIQYEYLYGRDMLIAPVYLAEKESWTVYLPKDNWIHLWSGRTYEGGEIEVEAKLGYPPAFYRKGSVFEEVFLNIQKTYGVK